MAIIRPGRFSTISTADDHRHAFDVKNEVLIQKQTQIDFLFFGDSITEFWELNAYFNKPGQIIINRGVGGDTTEFGKRRFMADVIQLNPKVCISLIGINDAWDLEYYEWLMTEGKSVEEVLEISCNNHRSMMDLSKSHNIELFVCSVLPTNMSFTNHEPERKKYAVLLNQELRKLCQEFNYTYVDYFSQLVQEDGLSLKDGFSNDGLHPLAKGYDIMTSILKNSLKIKGYEI